MNNKVILFFVFTALLMFSQYTFPNSFADSVNATTYSVSDVNTTATPVIQSVAYQSSLGTSGSSAVQAVATQSVATQSAPVQAVAVQSDSIPSSTVQVVAIQSVPVQTVTTQSSNTQPSTVQAVAVQSDSIPSSTVQAVATQSAPVQVVTNQTVPVQVVTNQTVPVQVVTNQTVPVQTVPVQTVPVHSVSSQSSNTQPSTVQAVATQTVPVQSVSTQSVSAPSVPVQASANQSSNTWNRGVTQSHTSQTANAGVSNYTPSQPAADNSASSTSSSPLKTISGQWANNQVSDSTFVQNAQHYINLGNYIPGTPIPQWVKDNAMLLARGQIDQSTFQAGIHDWLSSYHSAYQSRPSNTPQYQQYVSSPNSQQNQQYVASNVPQSTSTTVTPNSATSYYGDPVTFTVTVTDPLISQSAISGTVSWSDGNVGGTFSQTYCTLYSASCTVTYTPSVNSPSGVTITAYYAGDSAHQSSTGTAYLTVNLDQNTTTTIVANSATYSNEADTFTATVTDQTGSPNAITGTLSWSDGNVGGTFSQTYCTLYSASCSVTYTPPVNSPSTVTITGTYSGDSTHRSSSSSSYLSVNLIHNTTTTVTPNPVTYSTGPVSLAAVVSDPLSSSNAITGTLSWSDNGASGTFSQTYCYTPSDCTTTYTPNVAYSGTVIITANYGGDSIHAASSGTTTMTPSSINPVTYTTSSNIQTDKTSYNPGNTVTITVNPQGAQAGQNVAILVTDPLSNIVASRTVQTDALGNSELQIGLSPTAQAGTYQISATALVNGNYLSYHATFSVTSQGAQISGLSIVSAQPTDQMGDKTVTSFSKGGTSYAKVVLSSNSTQTVLVTVNLVGSDGTSLGVGSVKTTLGAGSSQMEVSFYIPSNASVGTGTIYVDTYSDWPSNGGVPLTGETSSTVSIG